MSLEAEIIGFLTAYLDAWNRYDVAQMRGLWDQEEAQPIYLAEEAEPHIGWAAIDHYWSVDRSKSVRELKIRDVVIKPSSADTAIAFYHMRWSTFIPGNRLYPNAFGNEVRVSAHLRRKADGWKLYHYIEAPLASLIQLRRMHEAQISEEFHQRVAARLAEA